MRLAHLIDRGLDLVIRCRSPGCGVATPLDPAFFAARRGADTDLDRLRDRLVCPGCGARDIAVEASECAEA